MSNVPNALTTLRILLVPVLMVFLLGTFRGHEWIALGVFLLAMLTDTVDGVLARRWNAVSELGKLLDPIADKLIITAAFICLVEAGAVPAWMAVIIIGRELAVTGFRAIAAAKGVVIAASWPGKIKVQLETYSIALLILGRGPLGKFYTIPQVLLWLAMIAAVVSAGECFIKYGPALVRE
jgi:CDP-diacylglycerol--glycerol-3-phosphate 3-phosphatidyltransferase